MLDPDASPLGGPIAALPDLTAAASAEALMNSVLDSLEGRTCILGADGTMLYTNMSWKADLDQSGVPAGGVGSNFFDLVRTLGMDDDSLGLVRDVVARAMSGEVPHGSAKVDARRGIRTEHLIFRVSAIADHSTARAVVRLIDITWTRATQLELERITDRAKLLALVAEHTDSSVVILDSRGHIEWVNNAFCRLTGYHSDDVVGIHRAELWQGRLANTWSHDAVRRALEGGEAIDAEVQAQSKDGRTYWAQIEIQPVLVDGEVVRFVEVDRDITTRREAEEQLRAKNQEVHALAERLENEKNLLATVLGSIPHLVYWKDGDRRYQGVNQAFLAIRGLNSPADAHEYQEDELEVHDELSDLLPPIEDEVAATGQAQLDHRVVLAGARRRELLLSVLPYGIQGSDQIESAGVVGVAADVTHLSELERQLAQASRLESIGQLAAGIAHEINTPVQYVSDNTRFVSESVAGLLDAMRAIATELGDTGGDEAGGDEAAGRLEPIRAALAGIDLDFLSVELAGALDQSLEGLNRVSTIVAAMKDFSHPGAERAEVELNRAIESTVKVSRNEWKYVATVNLDLAPDVGLVPCYEGELKQVLLNIIVNAAQAIAEQRQGDQSNTMGQITISTRRSSDKVEIVIADDGPGMTEDVRLRVFDPFFTTKPVGKGTGQGLNMSFAIVKKHGGHIGVDSSPGHGTRFVIDLPLRP